MSEFRSHIFFICEDNNNLSSAKSYYPAIYNDIYRIFCKFAAKKRQEVERPLHIDVREAVEAKAPRYAKRIPGFVYRWLERIVRQKELNKVLKENSGRTGVDFAEGVLNSFNIKLEVEGLDNLTDGQRYIFASNHPLGGLDGMALITILGRKYNGNVKCIVNDILMLIKPLNNVFLPINKHGSQSRRDMEAVDQAYSGDCQLITFPAGLCSRRGKDGQIRDTEWKKSFITKSVESRRDIVPVYFEGTNSGRFYKLANLRKRIGIRLNIEMVMLPGEMVDKSGSTLRIKIGTPIPYATFDGSRPQKEWAQEVKRRVYDMSTENK